MDIRKMRAEVLAWATANGLEPDTMRTFSDECAILHNGGRVM